MSTREGERDGGRVGDNAPSPSAHVRGPRAKEGRARAISLGLACIGRGAGAAMVRGGAVVLMVIIYQF